MIGLFQAADLTPLQAIFQVGELQKTRITESASTQLPPGLVTNASPQSSTALDKMAVEFLISYNHLLF